MASGEVTATVSVVIEASDSRNVIAELPGSSDDGRVVVLGGHYDTVPDTQGANDNGSGIAALITIARHISQMQFPFTVRFIAFGSEEIASSGSRHYVGSLTEEERGSIIAMLNFDVPGSGEVVEAIGSADLVTQVTDYADEHDLAVEQGTSLDSRARPAITPHSVTPASRRYSSQPTTSHESTRLPTPASSSSRSLWGSPRSSGSRYSIRWPSTSLSRKPLLSETIASASASALRLQQLGRVVRVVIVVQEREVLLLLRGPRPREVVDEDGAPVEVLSQNGVVHIDVEDDRVAGV